MLAVAFVKIAFGDGITAESAHYELRQTAETGGLLTVFLVLRAFASGCTALTGVEAVSNGIPRSSRPRAERRRHALHHGLPGDHDVRRDHGAAVAAHVHMAEDRRADRLPRRTRSAPR
jgi:hypothetical protein